MTLNTVQSTYTTSIPSGFAGMIADTRNRNVLSRTVEDAAGIGFGKPAFRGAGDRGCTATPALNAFMGFTIVRHDVQATPASPSTDLHKQYSSAPLLDEGCIWVAASVAVADGDQVYVTPAGLLTNVSASGVNFILPARYEDTITAAGLVRIRIRQDDQA
jgi:hypothetical protein